MNKLDTKLTKLRLTIDQLEETLANSDYYKYSFLSALKECTRTLEEQQRQISKIVCYGLGNISYPTHSSPRYQLALLRLLCKQLDAFIIDKTILIFDPAFVQEDIKLLESYDEPKFLLIPDNEHCAREVDIHEEAGDSCTLFYMPHLYKYLYNNLLGANWSAEKLGRLIVFGNSFRSMVDNEVDRKDIPKIRFLDYLVNGFSNQKGRPSSGKRKNKHVTKRRKDKLSQHDRVNSLFLESPVDDCGFPNCGFNDLSFNWIEWQALKELPASLFVETSYSGWLIQSNYDDSSDTSDESSFKMLTKYSYVD